MKQEEKELLLVDLCARLPYGVKIEGYELPCIILNSDWLHFMYTHQEFALRRPYLRPMSSMTEEECIELGDLNSIMENVGEHIPNIPYYIEIACIEQIDWLNANHFDYRGLIPMGLALEAYEGMYNLNEK